jgi:restriction system protein
MKPDAFERLAQRLLRESGFVKVEVSGKSGDGGIDGSGVLRMNLISFQVLFQCKRYKGSVASEVVRNFRGAMQGRADKGLIITTGTFTAEARREATRDGAPAIDLIDGEALCQLLKDKRLGVDVRQVVHEEIAIVPEFFMEV